MQNLERDVYGKYLLCQEKLLMDFFYSSILYLVPKPVPIYMYEWA